MDSKYLMSFVFIILLPLCSFSQSEYFSKGESGLCLSSRYISSEFRNGAGLTLGLSANGNNDIGFSYSDIEKSKFYDFYYGNHLLKNNDMPFAFSLQAGISYSESSSWYSRNINNTSYSLLFVPYVKSPSDEDIIFNFYFGGGLLIQNSKEFVPLVAGMNFGFRAGIAILAANVGVSIVEDSKTSSYGLTVAFSFNKKKNKFDNNSKDKDKVKEKEKEKKEKEEEKKEKKKKKSYYGW